MKFHIIKFFVALVLAYLFVAFVDWDLTWFKPWQWNGLSRLMFIYVFLIMVVVIAVIPNPKKFKRD